jgi:hypothetical protein
MRSRMLWFAALAAALAIVCVLFAATASPAPFAYDEADYMYAATQGFAANYLDRGSLGMTGFIEKGLALMRDKSQRQSMSAFVRNSGDLDFYRHYHGPIYAYWIAAGRALGVRGEGAYRSSGLILHALGTIVIFWMFLRVFPELPVQAAFVAGVMFAMSRTELVTATAITQHVVFTFLACCTLFAVAEFLRSGRDRWWYAAAALMAASFAAVEIAAVMIGSVVLTIVLLEWRRGFKYLLGLFARGAVCFVAVLAILWPPGVFKLDALKGYAYLAYVALGRKTFTPIGPLDLWGFKLRTYPLEFVLPLSAMLVGALWLWRTNSFRRSAPFLFYAIAFFGVTLVITAPYTYYHSSLAMALAVVTGVLFGELWSRWNAMAGSIALAAVLASLLALDAGFYRERARERSVKPAGTADVLAFLDSHRPDGPLFVPYVMVPPLHFYRPDVAATGYDETWTGEELSRQAEGLDSRTLVFCGSRVCRELDPSAAANLETAGTLPDTDEPMYAMRIARR